MKSKGVTLGSLATVTSGGTPDRQRPEFWGGDVPWVKTTLIQNCEINREDIDETITEVGLKKSSTKIIPAGSILLAMIEQGRTRGQVALLKTDAAINQNCAALILKAGIDARYVYQQLLYRYDELRNASNSSGQQNLNARLIRTFKIPSVDVTDQPLIGALLSDWDKAIGTTERLIAAKEQTHNALANELFFGQSRATRWPAIDIASIAQEVSSTNAQSDDLPVLSCTKHDGLVESLKYFDKQVFSHDTSKYKLVRRGQFVYATNHIEEGSIGLQDIVSAGLVSPMYTVFKVQEERVDARYLYKLLKTERLRQVFASKTNASVDRRGSLRWNAFSRIQVRLPPIDEQRRVRGVLDDAKLECDLLRARADALRLQKRGLMQKLLAGKWRVPVYEGVIA